MRICYYLLVIHLKKQGVVSKSMVNPYIYIYIYILEYHGSIVLESEHIESQFHQAGLLNSKYENGG